MTLSLWLDPEEDIGSPEPDRVATVTDKSDAGNDVVTQADVALLCGFEGANGATSYSSDDLKEYAFTFSGGAQLSNTQAKFGTTSLDAVAALDYIRVTPSPGDSLSPGTGDFTIEFWVYPTGTSGYSAAFDQRTASSSVCIYIGINTSSKWVLYVSAADRITSSTNAAANVWTHICVERVSGTSRLFVNGIQEGSDYADSNNYGANDTTIGARSAHNNGGGISAYIDDFRMVLGTAVHGGAAFTPNTTPLTGVEIGTDLAGLVKGFDFELDYRLVKKLASSPTLTNMDGPDITAVIAFEAGDDVPIPATLVGVSGLASPLDDTGWRIEDVYGNGCLRASVGDQDTNYIDMVADDTSVFLANFDGDDASTTYSSQDRNKRTATFFGTAQLDTAEKKFGASSVYLDGNSDYVSFPHDEALNFSNKDFTVEFWCYWFTDPSATSQQFLTKWTTVGSQGGWSFSFTVNNLRLAYSTTGADTVTGYDQTWNPDATTWYHVAYVRSGGFIYHFVDGVQLGTEIAISATIYDTTANFEIGSIFSGSRLQYFSGYIDDVRITVGEGRYTASFNPPTRTYTDSRGTNTQGAAILSLVYDSTSSSLYGFNSGRATAGIEYTGTPGFAHDLVIGDGHMGRVFGPVYYDGALGNDDIQRLEGYMAHRYNLTEALPDAHPFKTKGPDKVGNPSFVATLNGVADATSYTAETGQAATFIGTAKLDATDSVYYGTSLFGDGNSDYLTFPDSDDYALGADFTVECWAKFDTLPSGACMMSSYDSQSGSNRGWIFGKFGGNFLRMYTSTDGGTSIVQFNDAYTFETGVWHHYAVTRKDNIVRMFVDGVQLAADAAYGSPEEIFNCTDVFRVGGIRGTGGVTDFFPGNIQDCRIFNDRAIYTEDFIPPYRNLVVPVPATVLANFNGPDAVSSPPGYTTEDAGARSILFAGNAQLDTDQKRFGVSSAQFVGSPESYMDIAFPSPDEFTIGTNDFTIEMWVRFDAIDATARGIFDQRASGVSTAVRPTFYLRNTNVFSYFVNGADRITGSTPVAHQWYHCVVERVSGVTHMYIDGVRQSAGYADTNNYVGDRIRLGGVGDVTTNGMRGWIDGFRFVNGTALYNGVKAPTTLFSSTDDPISDVLLNFEGASPNTVYTSDDVNQYTVTFQNNGVLSNAQRYVGTSCLSIPATSDHAELPCTTAPGTNDFTMECMAYFTSFNGSYNAIMDHRTAGSSVTNYVGYIGGSATWYHSGAARITGGTIVANQWYHICVERVDGVVHLYLDGVSVGSYTTAASFVANATALHIGSDFNGGAGMNGYIDMVRYSATRAIHFGDFTPPTMPPGEPII